MRTAMLLCASALLVLAGCAAAPRALPAEGPAARVDAAGLALDGFDPVAYFDGGAPRRGDPAIEAEHDGARYRFASVEHRDRFLAEPERYAPAYGGWCAWALADGDGALVEVDPRSFLIEDGRLLLFYDGVFADTRASWRDGDRAALRARADANWRRISAGR